MQHLCREKLGKNKTDFDEAKFKQNVRRVGRAKAVRKNEKDVFFVTLINAIKNENLVKLSSSEF